MLRTNLSTRPFYNERAVRTLLAIAGALVVAFTMFNLAQIVLLTRGQSDLHDRAGAAEAQARELRAHAAQVRQGLNTAQLAAVSTAAQEANAIISQRLFSWTDLLNRLETTLPDEVRITSVRPSVDKDDVITVQMTIVARRVEDVEKFMENLEATRAFSNVGVRNETTDDDLLMVAVDGRYAPPAAEPAAGGR